MVKQAGTIVSGVAREEPLAVALGRFDGAAAVIREASAVLARQFEAAGKPALPPLDAAATSALFTGHYGIGAEFGNGLNVVSQLDFMLPEDRRDGLLAMVREPGQLAAHARERTARGADAAALQAALGLPQDETKQSVLANRLGLMERWAEGLPDAQKAETKETLAALRQATEALEGAIADIGGPDKAQSRGR